MNNENEQKERIRSACLQAAELCAKEKQADEVAKFLHCYSMLTSSHGAKPPGLESGRAIRDDAAAIALDEQSKVIKAMQAMIVRWRRAIAKDMAREHVIQLYDDGHMHALRTIVEEMRGYE